MDIPQEMLDAKDSLATALSAALPELPGVLGVDVGLREDGPELTDDLVIRVLVADADNVPSALSAQTAAVGFPVVVVERAMTPLVDTASHDPLVGGIQVSAAHGGALILQGAGTLGGFAADTEFGGQVGVSCAHVLAESDQPVQQGDPIYQPDSTRQIGHLHRWVASTDIAVFSVDDIIAFDASIADLGAVAGMARANVGDRVRKRGRTTELTIGKVNAIGLQPLGIGTPANSFEIWAADVNDPIFCKPGDSGSLIINDQNHVVGILTQKGIDYSRIVTIGNPPDGAISGFATQMATDGNITGAADSVGIAF